LGLTDQQNLSVPIPSDDTEEVEMKRKISIFISITILLFSSLACSIGLPFNTAKTGETEVFTIDEEDSTASNVKLTFAMGAGKFTLQPGAKKLVEGTVTYNISELKPVIERGVGSLYIHQDFNWDKIPIDPDNTINEWNLKLGSTPMDLTINGGAYEANFDLSGLAITDLDVNEGASSTEITFSQPNPETIERISYHTGASQVKITGLANANFKEMNFSSGAGSYTLDFSGTLRQDANVTINSAVSEVKIIVPVGMNAQVDVQEGVSNVDINGTWTSINNVYSTSGSGPVLYIKIQMGLGNVVLDQISE
jgi:hypothetical protein